MKITLKQTEAHVMLGSQILLNVLDIKQKRGHELSFEFLFFLMLAFFSKSTLDVTPTLEAMEVEECLAGATCRLSSRIGDNSGNRESWIWEKKWSVN